jgi:hypothetical protein
MGGCRSHLRRQTGDKQRSDSSQKFLSHFPLHCARSLEGRVAIPGDRPSSSLNASIKWGLTGTAPTAVTAMLLRGIKANALIEICFNPAGLLKNVPS